MPLNDETCQPCKRGEGKLTSNEAMVLMGELNDWTFYPDHLEKRWEFKSFKEPVALVNKIVKIAHAQDHHPEIRFGWGYVELVIATHSVGGLTRNDFILAAKIDEAATP